MEQQENKFELLKGDKVLWMVIILISFFSVFPVYSAGSNLEYIVQNGTTTGHVIKHMFFVFLGLAITLAIFLLVKPSPVSIKSLASSVAEISTLK